MSMRTAGAGLVLLLMAAVAGASETIWIEGESCSNHTYNRHSWYSGSGLNRTLFSPGVPEVSDGDVLGHYSNTDTPAEAHFDVTLTEGGAYTWWLRCSTFYSVQKYRIDTLPWLAMNQDGREQVNLVAGGIDIRFLSWIKVCVTNLAAGPHTFSVRIEQGNRPGSTETHGYIDCMCIDNSGWAPAGGMAPGSEPAPGAATWWVLHAGDDPDSPQSITDMSHLLHRPAGKHGFLRQEGDHYEFGDGTPVKFWGCGAAIVSEATMSQQARYYAKNGINMVRLHPVEGHLGVLLTEPGSGRRYFDSGRLDQLDRWFAALKEEGIYSTWSLFYPHDITTNDTYSSGLRNELPSGSRGKNTSGMVNFMQDLQDAQWEFASRLLNHTNAYTGLAYKDDPALAVVEAHNEDCIFWHAPLNDLANRAGPYPLHSAELRRMWMDWVAARYTNNVNLAAAWGAGIRGGDSVTNPDMDIYGAWEMAAAGPSNPNEKVRMGDFIWFCADTQRAFFEQRRLRLHALGFQSSFVTTAWQAGGPAANAANIYCDDIGNSIDRHAYAGGGIGGHSIATGAVYNVTHLGDPGTLLLSESFQQVEDKPFAVSEWNMNAPSQWRAEAAPLFAFYGMGLHGWDALYHFTASKPWLRNGWPGNGSYVTETPLYLGQFPALAFAVHRGHIKESTLVAARRLSVAQIFRGYDAFTQNLPEGGYPTESNLQTPDEVVAIGRITAKVQDGQAASYKAAWTQYWDQAAMTIESVTGELTWDYSNRVVLVKSEKTQGVIGWAGGKVWNLPDVTVNVTTPFVVLLFTPLDDQPLARSESILITALAQDRQWNAEYNGDGSRLNKLGGPPLFLQPVQAQITFGGTNITSARAVDIYGVPTTNELVRAGNTITIDGNYRTYYCQVRRGPALRPLLTGAEAGGSAFSFSCASLVPRAPYVLQRTESLTGAPFEDVTNLVPSGLLADWSYLETGAWDRAYFRLRREDE